MYSYTVTGMTLYIVEEWRGDKMVNYFAYEEETRQAEHWNKLWTKATAKSIKWAKDHLKMNLKINGISLEYRKYKM
jgi:hypothetical protein